MSGVDGPLRHILRPSVPWRPEGEYTECGRLAVEFAATVTAADALALIKKHGKARAAFLLCQTCTSTMNRWSGFGPVEVTTWASNPVGVLRRYADRATQRDEVERTERELRAVGMLIEAHSEEFHELVEGMAEAVSLADRRVARRYRAQASR